MYKQTEDHRRKINESRKLKKNEIYRKVSEKLKGKPKSDIHKKKLSEARKGIKLSDETKNKLSIIRKGKSFHSETQRKLLSERFKILWGEHYDEFCLRNKITNSGRFGDKNSNWKGGISKEGYPYLFNNILKEEIKRRDNYTCQNPNCNRKTKKLTVHHINYKKYWCCQTNLITLCVSCNSKANSNRKNNQLFYWNIIGKIYGFIKGE